MISIPNDIGDILAALEKRGHKAYAVGGCVRDSLLGIRPHDWDIATSALPESTMEIFALSGAGDIGKKYGVVTVGGVQVATFRREGAYSDHRRPDTVEFVPDLETDLARRDFTVNAMAADRHGGVADPFNGRDDLANRLIRCVGDPARRFSEDALRILRALRFASVLDFSIEDKTRGALLASADTLRYLTKKVTAREMEKLRAGPGAERILQEFGPLIPALNAVQ